LYYAPYPFIGEFSVASSELNQNTSFSYHVPDGQKYYVAVKAYNAAGESEYSNHELISVGSSWSQNSLADVKYTFSLVGKSKNTYVVKGDSFTFRPTTLSYVTISYTAKLLASYYLENSEGNIGHYRKTNLLPDWIERWTDHMKGAILGGLFGDQAGIILDHVTPSLSIPSGNTFAAYIEPSENYAIHHEGVSNVSYELMTISDLNQIFLGTYRSFLISSNKMSRSPLVK